MATEIVAVEDVRARVGNTLSDDLLQQVINEQLAAITTRLGAPYAGPTATITDDVEGQGEFIFLRRRIGSIVSITEREPGSTAVAVAASEYETRPQAGMVQRVTGSWASRVSVTYVPIDDRPEWREAVIALVQMDLAGRGYFSESVGGEYSYTRSTNPDADRAKVLQRLTFWKV